VERPQGAFDAWTYQRGNRGIRLQQEQETVPARRKPKQAVAKLLAL
jgi:hypothetical protein